MNASKPRILVGRVWHESNGFNPVPTNIDDFQITRGEELLHNAAASGSTLGGIITRLVERGAIVIPSLSMTAPPSGLVEHELYEWARDTLIDCVRRTSPDGIALELHGAMGTTRVADAEGDLLGAVRREAGPDIPIAIGLDLHAHVTDAMLAAVDICIACKENPHSDVVECGRDTADHLLSILDGSLQPVTTMCKVPMILPGAAETASGPLADQHALARQIVVGNRHIRDISLFNVFRYADDDDIGQAAVVLADGRGHGARAAQELARRFWSERERYRDHLLPIEEALDRVADQAGDQPFVLADMGDRVLAGAPGDSTAILQVALKRQDGLRGALPVTDPHSARQAIIAGLGATLSLDIGGRMTPGFSPFRVKGEVVYISNGDFVLKGPFQGGERSSLGPTAVLLVDDRIHILLTSRPGFSHDPAMFTSQGIDLSVQGFVVVKSGYHFTLNFRGSATPLLLQTPGVGYYTKGMLSYRKSHFWPEHDVGEPAFEAREFIHPRVVPAG